MKKIYFLILLLFFTGCADKTGFTTQYYDECQGEYDYYGVYHEKCPNNFLEYKTIKKNYNELKEKVKEDHQKAIEEQKLKGNKLEEDNDPTCLQCN